MAISAFGGFSIREYAFGMRKADANKCWPFGGEVQESALPPIECRRYRWWSSELEIHRSAEGMAKSGDGIDIREHAVIENVEPSGSGREDHGEGKMRFVDKYKVRAPKKRSIVEIFAVSTQVDAEVASAENLEEEGMARYERAKFRVRKSTKGNCVVKVKTKQQILMKKRFRKRKNGFSDGLFKEEKISRSIEQSPADVTGSFCKTKNKDVIIQSTEKEKTVEKEGCNHPVDSSLSFFVSETSGPALGSADKIDSQGENVRIDPGEKQIPSTLGWPHMQSLYRVFSDVLAAASVITNSLESKTQPLPENINGTENHPSIMPSTSIEVPDLRNTKGLCCPSAEKRRSVELVDLNNPAEASCSFVDPEASERDERITPNVNVKSRIETISTEASLPSISEVVIPSLPLAGNSNEVFASSPSVAIRKRKRKRIPQGSHDDTNYPCFPKESMKHKNIPGWMARELPPRNRIPQSTYSERSFNRDMITHLPMNMQGEHTYMQLNKQEEFEQLLMKKNWAPLQVNRLPLQNYSERSGQGLNNHQDNKTHFRHESDIKFDRRIGNLNASEFPLGANFCTIYQADLPAQTTVPTMRLMGTNVTVGQSNKEHRRSDKAKSILDQRIVSVTDLNVGIPGSILPQVSRQRCAAYMTSHLPAYQIQNEPRKSKPSNFNFDLQHDDPPFCCQGSGNISGGLCQPIGKSHSHGAEAWLKNKVLRMRAEAPVNPDQNWLLNSSTWKHGQKPLNPWCHISNSSVWPPNEGLTHRLRYVGSSRSSGLQFPGIPATSSLVRAQHNLSSELLPRFASLPTFDFINGSNANCSTSRGNGVVKSSLMGEHPSISGRNAVYRPFDVNDETKDGSSRSRPVKLRAGAKHILLPSSKMDRKKPVAVNSTAPFSWEMGPGSVPVQR